jgi:TatD DNase family protein
MTWIDLHAHLDKLPEGPEEALRKAQASGIYQVVTIGTDPNDLQVVLNLGKKYYPHVFCTLGIHPHDAISYTDEVESWIREKGAEVPVVALGEMGLDFYYNHSERGAQQTAFERQLYLAQELQLPVEIHTRDAEEETLSILEKFRGSVGGIIHCFTGTEEMAYRCLDLGFNISISGVVTFKKAHSLRSTVEKLPLDRIHIETDSPFLAPVPQRGQSNTPAFLIHTAEFVAQLKKVPLDQFKLQMEQNARRLFPKLVPLPPIEAPPCREVK